MDLVMFFTCIGEACSFAKNYLFLFKILLFIPGLAFEVEFIFVEVSIFDSLLKL